MIMVRGRISDIQSGLLSEEEVNMRRAIFFALATILTVVAAHAYLGQIVRSFPLEGTVSRGLAIGPGYLYDLHKYSESSSICSVYVYHPDTGSRYTAWNVPTKNEEYYGCAYTGDGYLWIAKYGNWVYQCHPYTGSVYASWRCFPNGLAPFCTGDYGAGATALFATEMNSYTIWKYDLATHKYISSFQNVYQAPQELAYDWRNKLVWSSYERGTIWACTTTGSYVSTFPKEIGRGRRGLAYSAEYLWVSSGNWCFKVHCPYNFVSTTPASWGQVKSLYR